MKELINKAFSIGLGLAVASKEQVEKLVDELVKKGEIKKSESNQYVEELVQKGNMAREEISQIVEERTRQLIQSLNIATKDEIKELKERIIELEKSKENL
ncbi:hypothetical protein H1Z61_05055 [Bacillus aquiflavi]|uniref:Polyhydroxyalkanoate synthesis regulator n=1 Tax=Bacillus aquiflavi TaxID=2672567 RepID=A0A6B3VSF3_9BACI|nr:hypothetical protein [Bacillus aquiflavi]MBA4536532.1 hypothetical protein [Bacillus aquiflavi]NEY80899.1 hypothetical protein [Bacillus aquiflavi]UAC49620.1 hypothetical protein K6959_07385 [Bacillus aquiflavi]